MKVVVHLPLELLSYVERAAPGAIVRACQPAHGDVVPHLEQAHGVFVDVVVDRALFDAVVIFHKAVVRLAMATLGAEL